MRFQKTAPRRPRSSGASSGWTLVTSDSRANEPSNYRKQDREERGELAEFQGCRQSVAEDATPFVSTQHYLEEYFASKGLDMFGMAEIAMGKSLTRQLIHICRRDSPPR